MKKIGKRLLPLLLTLLFALCSTGCLSTMALYYQLMDDAEPIASVQASPTPKKPAATPTAAPDATDAPHEGVSFDEMEYVRPDMAAFSAELTALIDDAEAGVKPETWLDRFASCMAQYDNAESQLSLSYLLYAFDVTEDYYQDEYEQLESDLLEIDVLLADAAIAILESDAAGDAAAEAWGEDFIREVYLSDELNSFEVQDLLKQEIALELDYDELLTTYVYREGGRTWTLEDLPQAYYAGQIDYEEYARLYDAYCAGLNKEAGKLFLELLVVRNEIASSLGYGSFAAYRYACYERDFSLEEAQALAEAVKETIVPLYYSQTLATQFQGMALQDLTFPLDPYIENLKAAAAEFSPRLAESLGYMLDNDLYDFNVDANKMEGSFTTYIGAYRAPFIFTQWEGSYGNVSTVIHELGHFTNDYFNPSEGWCCGYSLDLAEVDSQGLELLMMHYYDRFYDRNAAAAEDSMLTDALYAVVSGCMEDEFQQYAYAHPDATLDELNECYASLAEDYGFAELYGYTGKEWTLVPHTFSSPMYYISYAASMLLSLELWAESRTDFDAAREAYWTILDRGSYDQFRTVAKRSGLRDPILPDTVGALAQTLQAEFAS